MGSGESVTLLMRYVTPLLAVLSFGVMGFYNPSFDCSNVKENSIEFRICSDEQLSALDRELAGLYDDAVLIDKAARQAQRQWLKARNCCADAACIERHYRERIEALQATLEAYSKGLQTAYLNAEQEYEKSHNVYKTIPLLENAGIRAIVDKRPSFLGEETYVTYLKTYASYYINTVEDTVHGDNLEYAQKILTHLTTIQPKDKEIYLLLGRSYMDLFRFSARASFIHNFRGISQHIEDWRRTPYLAKQAYLAYVQRCQEEGVPPGLSKEEQAIVERDRLFIEYFSSFTGRAQRYFPPFYEENLKWQPGFENVGSEFVAMLNTLPDDELTKCSRYVNEADSAFEYVRVEDVPEKYQSYFKNGEYIHWHLFKYKGEYFVDEYGVLVAGDSFLKFMEDGAEAFANMSIDSCDYQIVDLRLRDQFYDEGAVESICFPQCGDIRNYRDIYKIIK
jgi:hypothetical protein